VRLLGCFYQGYNHSRDNMTPGVRRPSRAADWRSTDVRTGWAHDQCYQYEGLTGVDLFNPVRGAGGLNLGYRSYQASATDWAKSYSSWVSGATTINQFVGDLLNHVPPYNVNAYGDYATSILGGRFKNPALRGASTSGTYQSVLKYASACGVNP